VNAYSSIHAEALTCRFGTKAAIDQLDLTVPRGGVTALLGPNGAGKTTFIRMALGLTKVSAGSLHVLGKSPGSLAARQRIGVMLQDTELPDLLTPNEHLELFASYYPAPRDIGDVIAACRITEFADRRYAKLSGGQKRRTQFALSLIGQPDLIFLDEPTTGLDHDARKALWQVINDLAQSGVSIFLTTHYLEEAEALADRVIVINHGRVIANENVTTLTSTLGRKIIRASSSLTAEQARRLPGVAEVKTSGTELEIVCARATQTLKALLSQDPDVENLLVSQPKLEDIFTELTREKPEV